ncbi:MAG: class I SAM-dependent methyltransferase [Balneolaceae bacterium]|nr:class I SAM-dependent methyltransferase [Balneolaceae bacterium]MCH8547803.1 class I SAM-dependent methyltransferase [Balneolaceae bacterium]
MKKSPQTIQKNYSVLAEIYDEVMAQVDYETWTDYIDEIILMHKPESSDVLELACGTGTMALSLEELDCYNITATDASPQMIEMALEKARLRASAVDFRTMNFLNLEIDKKFDVVYMVFDSLNYLHQKEEIIELHNQVQKVLKPDGIFIYDFTTPRNSRTAIRFLNDEKKRVNDFYRYHRKSSYDPSKRIHTNKFLIQKRDEQAVNGLLSFKEEHTQRIYTKREIEDIIKSTDFTILDAFDGFELKPAHSRSLRITMVLK